MKNMRFAEWLMLAMLLAAAVGNANAECSACKGGSPSSQQDVLNEEWAAFLSGENVTAQVVSGTDGLVTPQYSRKNNAALQSDAEKTESQTLKTENSDAKQDEGKQLSTDANQTALSVQSSGDPQRSNEFAAVLAPLTEVNNSDIILDISPSSTEYIPGAISIPYTEFLESGGALKTVSEMAQVLAGAGISEDDSVLIYGECQPCGGGPSAATYVYWIMKYLGHEKLKLLDGGIDDWVAALEPTANSPASLSPTTYTPAINANLLANFEFVNSGSAQIIDARSETEFEAGSIPGSINIPYDRVLDGKKIKDEEALKELFASLDKDRPVVVYTNTGVKASMPWLALTLLGYDARLYSWQDWQASLPHLNVTLEEANAEPNPAKTGDAVSITATFAARKQSVNADSTEPDRNDSINGSGNETILTIKGCATCGFGSAQGYADLSSSDGVVKIGSASQEERAAANNGFTVLAYVKGPSGDTVSKVIMKRIKSGEDDFSGIWNANVDAGIYTVDIEATEDDITETFPAALQIEVKSGK